MKKFGPGCNPEKDFLDFECSILVDPATRCKESFAALREVVWLEGVLPASFFEGFSHGDAFPVWIVTGIQSMEK